MCNPNQVFVGHLVINLPAIFVQDMATCAWITYSSSIPIWGPPTLLSNRNLLVAHALHF